MESEAIRADLVKRICDAVRPDRIVLFGSRGRGQGGPESDFDILVVMDSPLPRYRRSGPLYAALADLPVEVDVVVYTPAEVQEWREVPQALVTTALREGEVLYVKQG